MNRSFRSLPLHPLRSIYVGLPICGVIAACAAAPPTALRPKRVDMVSSKVDARRPTSTSTVARLGPTSPEVSAWTPHTDYTLDLVRDTYERIHAQPELGHRELRTAKLLRERLSALGYRDFVASKLAPTTVITVLDTGRPGPTVGLRAEMDARKIEGEEPLDHHPRSQVPQRMHNCGHDAHAAMLLGAAAILADHPERLAGGRIAFIFQPAEETKGGADDIVNEGLLDALGIDYLFAQHAVSGLPVGVLSISPGATLAGSNYFTLILEGRGAHAALPSGGSDIPLVAAKVVLELSNLPARTIDIANRPLIISVSRIQSGVGGSLNVLPETAKIEGTIRAFEHPMVPPPGEPSIDALIRTRLNGMAETYGIRYTLDLRPRAPPTDNDAHLFAQVVPKLASQWRGRLDTTPYRGMFSEDFSYYTAKVPSLYFGLGIARDGLGSGGVHTRAFTIHPDALSAGTESLVRLAEIASRLRR